MWISLLIANLHVAVWPFFFVLFLPYIAEYLFCAIVDLDLILKLKKLAYVIKKKIFFKNAEKIKIIEEKIISIDNQREKIKQRREENRKHPYKIKISKAVLLHNQFFYF